MPDSRSFVGPTRRKGRRLVPIAGPSGEPAPQPEAEADQGYEPGDHTVDEVKVYVEANPDQADAVYDAEQAGKNRVTLLDWLTSRGS